MNQGWLKLIIDNWAQVTVILGAIGIILKTLIDWSLKKREIKFVNIQQNKIPVVKEFFKNYLRLERKLREYQIITAQGFDERRDDVRKELLNQWESFEISFHDVRLFLPDADLELLDEIKVELEDIHRQLDFFHTDKSFGVTEHELVLTLRKIRDEVFPKKLPELINRIENNIRKDYGLYKEKPTPNNS